ncbi:MAG: hypothetical protein SGBAC_009893 [Bacillariaceae sp.]
MRTPTFLTSTDKDTESSYSSTEYSEEDSSKGHEPSITTLENGKEAEAVADWEESVEENGNQQLSMLDKFFPFAPQPPKKAPHVDEQLQVDLLTSERSILMLKAEVDMLREQLEYQQDDYLSLENGIRKTAATQDAKDEAEQKLVQRLLAEHEQELEQQRQALETTQKQLQLAQKNVTALETDYEHRLVTQSKQFALQQEQPRQQIADLSAQLQTVTVDFEKVSKLLKDQTQKLQQVQQAADSQKETLQQQIVKLEASLTDANSTNLQLQESLTSSHADLETLQQQWQDMQASGKKQEEAEAEQVAILETQNNETKLALQVAEELLQKTVMEKEQLNQEAQTAWSLEKEELESQVESLQLQLTSETITKEKVLSQWKSAQIDVDLAKQYQQRQLQENQATVDTLQTKLEETKAQYETDLESMLVQNYEDAQTLTNRIQTEHDRREQELEDENALLKAELAKMTQRYKQSEQERQDEVKLLHAQLTEQLETAQAKATQLEQALQTQLETAKEEQGSKIKSLEKAIAKLQQENEDLQSSLVEANASREESTAAAIVLHQKYADLRANEQKWEERVSLMKREFQHALDEKKEIETKLVAVTLEKEESLLKTQALEANLQVLVQQNSMLLQQQQAEQRRKNDENNSHWAIDKY